MEDKKILRNTDEFFGADELKLEDLDGIAGGVGVSEDSDTPMNKYDPGSIVMYQGERCKVWSCIVDTFGNENWLYRIKLVAAPHTEYNNVPERELSPA